MLSVRLFGMFSVRYDGEPVIIPSRPSCLLLVNLLLHAGQPRPREWLADLLWPDAEADNARSNLRHALWRLRRALPSAPGGRSYLCADAAGLAFNDALPYFLDVSALQRCPEETAPIETLADAVALYNDELLPGWYESWIVQERERLQAVYARKAQALLARLSAAGSWPEVIRWAEHWIACDRTAEPAFRALMTAHAVQNDVGHLIADYERCRAQLRAELGVEPSAATRELLERLYAAATGGRLLPPPYGKRAAP